jgi:hypothetical protein
MGLQLAIWIGEQSAVRARTPIWDAFAVRGSFQNTFGQHGSAHPRLLARRQTGPSPIQRGSQEGDGFKVEVHGNVQFPGIMNATFLQ